MTISLKFLQRVYLPSLVARNSYAVHVVDCSSRHASGLEILLQLEDGCGAKGQASLTNVQAFRHSSSVSPQNSSTVTDSPAARMVAAHAPTGDLPTIGELNLAQNVVAT